MEFLMAHHTAKKTPSEKASMACLRSTQKHGVMVECLAHGCVKMLHDGSILGKEGREGSGDKKDELA